MFVSHSIQLTINQIHGVICHCPVNLMYRGSVETLTAPYLCIADSALISLQNTTFGDFYDVSMLSDENESVVDVLCVCCVCVVCVLCVCVCV